MKTKTIYFTNGTTIQVANNREARKFFKRMKHKGNYHEVLQNEYDGQRIYAFFNPRNPQYLAMLRNTANRWYQEEVVMGA